MILDDVIVTFQLDKSDREVLKKTIKVYSDNFLSDKIKNLFLNFLNDSDWNCAIKILKNRSFHVIRTHLLSKASNEELENKALALSQFVLRYLISKEVYRFNHSSSLISRNEWDKQSLERIPLSEIIDRASFGDGIHLPELNPQVIRTLMINERNHLLNALSKFEIFMDNTFPQKTLDPAVFSEVKIFTDLFRQEIRQLLLSTEYISHEFRTDNGELPGHYTILRKIRATYLELTNTMKKYTF